MASIVASSSQGRESGAFCRDNVSPKKWPANHAGCGSVPVSSSYEHLLPSNVGCGAEPAGCVRWTEEINWITPTSASVLLDLG